MTLIEDTPEKRRALFELLWDQAERAFEDNGQPAGADDVRQLVETNLGTLGLQLTVERVTAVDHETELLRAGEVT